MGFGLDSDQQYLYGTSGRVVNPANGAIVFTYPILGFSNSVIRDTDRTYFLDFSGKIVAFDQNQQRLGELALPQQGTNLVRWCEDGFAVLLNSISGQVIIFRPPLARR
jgi:RNase P/RNase MRP subunit p29